MAIPKYFYGSTKTTLNFRNTFGWLVGLSYEAAKLDILIISLIQNSVTY